MSATTPAKESSFMADLRRFFRSMKQTRQQVLVRMPGWRTYGYPEDAITQAKNHWEYALLSLVAYAKAAAIKRAMTKLQLLPTSAEFVEKSRPDYTKLNFDPEDELIKAGWVCYNTFVDDRLDAAFKAAHLRLEVWMKKDSSALAVAFGGTVATSLRDWQANLRWILPKLPGRPDEYTVCVTKFVPGFLAALEKESLEKPPVIYSTGHSLGGGLAQQFAYALPDQLAQQGLSLPRVIQVYAFDTSPVTGFYSLEEAIRAQNAKGLQTDRVFERGEVLAFLRAVLALVRPPSRINPAIRTVRYNFLGRVWPIHAHNISLLAQALYDATHVSQPSPPRPPSS
ncbi:hypothetical protein E1N52_38980 [Paraburkholderia guartelaensis]|uniref:Fungal lipase-type domain-containing protein n=1 Tax=Paraburkholderia guartelaensis TaxID=2546446 RepID=A0A4V2ZUZ3_9BURK|nr:hypothetical protein [Paraburkholderia guartelaensis]TDG02625.1 hypothetical protein E1N52_38980 [Paraburkholderia guartelaensis]